MDIQGNLEGLEQLLVPSRKLAIFRRGETARYYVVENEDDFRQATLKEFVRMNTLSDPRFRLSEEYLKPRLEKTIAATLDNALMQTESTEEQHKMIEHASTTLIECMSVYNILNDANTTQDILDAKLPSGEHMLDWFMMILVEISAMFQPIRLDVTLDGVDVMKRALLFIPAEETGEGNLSVIAYNASTDAMLDTACADLILQRMTSPFLSFDVFKSFEEALKVPTPEELEELHAEPVISADSMQEVVGMLKEQIRREMRLRQIKMRDQIEEHYNLFKPLKDATTKEDLLALRNPATGARLVREIIDHSVFYNGFNYVKVLAENGEDGK